MVIKILIGFLLYIGIGSLVPFLKKKKVSKQTIEKTHEKSYTSETFGPDKASVIIDSSDALNIRIEAVRSATETIDIVMYKIVDSESTRAFFGEVYAAAERGVKIRILVNGITYLFYKNQKPLKALNAHPSISSYLYHPVNLLKPWRLHFMMHDKMIVIDDRYLLTGGRNVEERHFRPVGYNKPIAYDLEIFVVNTKKRSAIPSVLEEARSYVDSLFQYEGTVKIDEKENQSIIQIFAQVKKDFLISNPQFYKKTLDDFINETVPTNKITFLNNPIHVGVKEPVLGYQLFYLAQQAKKSLIVQTPYITWDPRIFKALRKLTNKIKVRIQTNSAVSTPNLFGFSNYFHNREMYLEAGIDIYEFQSTDSVHNKSFVLDDRLSIIGTFNIDARSLSINSEIMLAVDGKEFTHYFLKDINRFQKQSLKVEENNQYSESSVIEALPVPTYKKILLAIFYVVLRPIQFLL